LLAFEDAIPVLATFDGMGFVREGDEAYRADGGTPRGALARLDNMAILIADLELLRLVDTGVHDPVAGAGIVRVELVLGWHVLLLDKDLLADLHGIEKGRRYCRGLELPGAAANVPLELARLEEGDEGRAHWCWEGERDSLAAAVG